MQQQGGGETGVRNLLMVSFGPHIGPNRSKILDQFHQKMDQQQHKSSIQDHDEVAKPCTIKQ